MLALAACGRIGFDPIPPPSDQCLVAIAGAGDPTCALRADGSVACWGANPYGEIGDGTMDAHVDPVFAAIDDAVGIGMGEFHSCAVTRDATARCWGKNDYGQIGDGTISPRLIPTDVYMIQDVTQIAAAQYHTCARHSDGHISCWGRASTGAVGIVGANVLTPTPVAGIANATHLTVGDYITCALANDRAHCWGLSTLLGDGSTTDRAQPGPVALPAGRVVDIAAGCHRHACALLENGSAWCWGDNALYQLGNGTRTAATVPVQVLGNASYVRISVGASHSCGLEADGAVWCWGDNAQQQIDGAPQPAPQPRRILLPEPVDQIEAGCTRTCARTGDRVWCWGDDAIAPVPAPQPIHEIAIPCPLP